MGWIRVPKTKSDSSGIALFLVVASMAVLSVLVTEFTYIAQVNQKMAFDGLDQLKAHYLAKSAFKISLLRLKAYQTVKDVVGGKGGVPGGIPGIPKSMIDKIWSFPFFYPIPTDVPGLTPAEKETIQKFQNESGLDGKFSALIASESGKFNINMVLAPFVPAPAPSPTGTPAGGGPAARPSPSPTPSFSPEEARKSLADYLTNVLNQKFEADPDFASEYRDFRMEEFMDNLVAWLDPTYERHQSGLRDQVTMKGAPMYTISELHMVPGMDDDLYAVFEPALTAAATPGINVNTMNEHTLRALLPDLNQEQVAEFMKFRDSQVEDNTFKTVEDFYQYLETNVFQGGNSQGLEQFKASLEKRHLRLVVDESNFKITVQAQVNQSIRLIEAWVTLAAPTKKESTPPAGPPGVPQPEQKKPKAGDAGLNVTFMRIL